MGTSGKNSKRLSVPIDPFELLYLAISIATFSHTVWASSFAFEGPPPLEGSSEMTIWQIKGILIAIAIDLGMLLSARFIARAGKASPSMILAFVVAAASSFYTQLLYILYHTTNFAIGSGVDPYWNSVLSPVVSARVVILPFLLPFLGIIYTVARVGREKKAQEAEAERERNKPVTVSDVLNNRVKISVPQPELQNGSSTPSLPSPEQDSLIVMDDGVEAAIKALGDAQVDLTKNRYYDPYWKAWSKPYDTKEEMVKAMITLGKRRNTMARNREAKKKNQSG